MRSLSAQDILQIWELGQSRHPIDRALLFLAAALPDKTLDELASLTIGQRDALLLTLREITIGSQLDSVAQCPQCSEALEFAVQVSDLRVVNPTASLNSLTPSDYCCTIDEFNLRFRLPNSHDLAAVVGCQDVVTAQRSLVERCLQQVQEKAGDAIEPDQVPDHVLVQLSEQMALCDPQAEMLLNLTCPQCQHLWQVMFDIVTFLWAELSGQAKRLLREVHLLARAYGWKESDILSMSAMRRQLYLELVGA